MIFLEDKIVHIFSKWDSNTYNMAKFFQNNMLMDNLDFLVWETRDGIIYNDPRLLAFLNIKYLPDRETKIINKISRIIKILKFLNEKNKIVIHSFKFAKGNLKIILVLLFFCKKITWIKTNNDFYESMIFDNKFKSEIYNYAIRTLKKKINTIYNRNFYNLKNEVFTFLNDEYIRCLDILHKGNCNSLSMKNYLNILIGENGLKRNKHLLIVDKLTNIDKEFNVLFFMNYAMLNEYGYNSTSTYRSKVIEYASRKLNKKVIGLNKKNVKCNNYFNLLNNIDAAVFAEHRFHNNNLVFYFLYLGKMVFIPKDSELYKFLRYKGLYVFDLEDVSVIVNKYSEFKNILQENMSNIWLKNYIHNIEQDKIWKKTLENIQNS